MQAGISSCRHAKGAPGEDDAREIEDALRRRDCERNQEEPQRPVSQLVDGLGNRAGTEIAGYPLDDNPERWQQGVAVNATIFTGDQRPDRSRRNGIGSIPLQLGPNILDLGASSPINCDRPAVTI